MFGYTNLWFIINYNAYFRLTPFFWHSYISQGSVATFVEYLDRSLLQIYNWVRQWKKIENRLIFDEVMGKSLVSCFLTRSVYVHRLWAWDRQPDGQTVISLIIPSPFG